ncbi:uncharacterized protein LOC107991270 [Cucumis melo]|uniref:Uncharacterized protein LOC107991270 n=1 Tax=Cucumis melo TaxID=3656 RepID=A0A1S4DZT7_CUCME|nr:uncharacterized protein LOC107991270 [Cucumis melo]
MKDDGKQSIVTKTAILYQTQGEEVAGGGEKNGSDDGSVVGIDGRDGKFGSEVVGRGGNATLVGMFMGRLGSGGSVSLGREGSGKFGMDGILGPVGTGGRGGTADGLGSDGIGGKFGIVCRRCREVRAASTLENAKVTMKARMKQLKEAIRMKKIMEV